MFSLLIRVFILAMSTIAELLSIVVALPPAIRAFVLSIRYRPPGLGMSEDQNQTDTYKKRTGATGGRPLDASRGLKYHDTPSTGLRDLVSSPDAFGNVARGDPLPYKLSDRALRLAGLTPETFRLHVKVDRFLQKHHVKRTATLEREMSFSLEDLHAIGAKRGVVRFMKQMQCLNIDAPLGQGVWEGVRLSDLLRECGKMDYVRRVNYFGFHNYEAGQRFRSSLSYTEVFEPVPGEPPVLVAYALNGKPLRLDRGGPVRMVVPSAHGYKSVKWLQQIQLTNDYRVSDTYAVIDKIGNDPTTCLKTYCSVEGADITEPGREAEGKLQKVFSTSELPILLSGVVVCGRTPLERVEYWVRRVDNIDRPSTLADDDDELLDAQWKPAAIEPPPANFGASGVDDVNTIFGFKDGKPTSWPLPMSYANWHVTIDDLKPGAYELRARTVDINGYAQPEPRPVQKSGRNRIGCRRIQVVA